MTKNDTDTFYRVFANCRCSHCDNRSVSVVAYRLGDSAGAAYVGLCDVCRSELERFSLAVAPSSEISYYRPTTSAHHSPLDTCCNESMPQVEIRLRSLFALFPRLEEEWDIACR